MAQQQGFDVIVAGAGPVGSIAALALVRSGFSVALVGPRAGGDDRRTTALMLPALTYLESIGLPEFSPTETAPLEAMRIVDMTRRLIRSAPVTFRAAEIDAPHFGVNIPNGVLMRMLNDAVASQPRISRFKEVVGSWVLDETDALAQLGDGRALRAPLIVAADGRASPARDAAGISVTRRDYPQSALVLNFGHSRPH